MNQIIKIGFLGCGNVGSGVWRLLNSFASQIEQRSGLSFEIKKILVRNVRKDRGIEIPQQVLTDRAEDILDDPEIQIVLEFLGGEAPAYRYVIHALQNGKTVVTANKIAFALHWREMQEAAKQSGAGLYYEAAVCGAIPIIHALEESLQANYIDCIYGIVNGTTNYILTQMCKNGTEYAEALAQAQKLGLAEPDPSSDVDGLDAAYKLSILASLAFHGHIPFENIFVNGIRSLQAEDIRYAKTLGYTVKLLAIAKRNGNDVETRVHPALIPMNHPLANVSDSFNAVFLRGHACGEMMFMGKGAGDLPTASALVSDLLRAASVQKHLYPSFMITDSDTESFRNNRDWRCAYYLRLIADDKPGVLSRVSQIFAKYGISIASLTQTLANEEGHATLVLITHQAGELEMNKAIGEFSDGDASVASLLRIEA